MTYKQRYGKFNAKKTEYNGYIYDSKLEAAVAETLDWRPEAKEIKDWERQFTVEMVAYDVHGEPAPGS